MDFLRIRNVRCFTNPKSVPLAPLTLLVGENSTGKSTFLALVRLAWDIAHGRGQLDFNEQPFLLGAFDQIANYRGGRAGRAKFFEIGLDTNLALSEKRRSKKIGIRFNSRFERSGSHAVIVEQSLHSPPYSLIARFPLDAELPTFQIKTSEKTVRFSLDPDAKAFAFQRDAPIEWMYLLYGMLGGPHRGPRTETAQEGFTQEEMETLRRLAMQTRFPPSARPVALAPIRTKPERTYHPVSDTRLPEGGHVPMVLARTFFENKEEWQKLKRSLDQFGQASGLFKTLQIRPLGKHESDPFQIRIQINGPASNLVDVGYGVSQALPIVVDSLLAERGQTYLLQQPEVHLHPRGQAELATFLGNLVYAQGKRFIVETHSDYLIDRVRMDVRDKGTIRPEDVAILFFERRKTMVNIHRISLDQLGNFKTVPRGYRRFFLEEERRFLGG